MKPFLLALLLVASGARAETPDRIFSPAEKGIALGLAASSIAAGFAFHGPVQARWTATLPIDRDLSRFLEAGTRDGSRAAQFASDGLVGALIVAPFLLVGNARWDARWQALESFSSTGLAAAGLKMAVGRERPYGAQCAANNLDQDCSGSYRNESFLSGHSAFAFTGAGLLCSFRDDAFCPVGIGLAAVTATLRVIGNQHYVTDVLAGAALGWASGFYLPRWLGRSGVNAGVVAGPNGALGFRVSCAIGNVTSPGSR